VSSLVGLFVSVGMRVGCSVASVTSGSCVSSLVGLFVSVGMSVGSSVASVPSSSANRSNNSDGEQKKDEEPHCYFP
ncbi:hypothetical protein PMAYCL1PPCAC_05077, partial [Pristionchus mayeri]